MPARDKGAEKKGKKSGNKVKKIIILLMAVSIMLTSCGKSAGLLNGGKRADNKTPIAIPTPKPQPQKDNDTVNKTLVASPSPKLIQPIKIYNDNIKQSWKGYAYDHIGETGLILSVIVVGSVLAIKWIINKINDKPLENNEQPQKLKPLPVLSVDYVFYNLGFFIRIISGDLRRYAIYWDDYSVEDLIYISRINGSLSIWKTSIKRILKKRGYDVSAL